MPNAASGQLLLKTEMMAGHGGVSGRYKSWRELAFEYAWIVDQIGPRRGVTGPDVSGVSAIPAIADRYPRVHSGAGQGRVPR